MRAQHSRVRREKEVARVAKRQGKADRLAARKAAKVEQFPIAADWPVDAIPEDMMGLARALSRRVPEHG
jgi:hypothetical protein